MRIRSIWFILGAVALPGLASAQTVRELDLTLDPATIGPSNCSATVEITAVATENEIAVPGLAESDRWEVAVAKSSSCSDREILEVDPFQAVVTAEGTYRTTVTAAEIIEAGTGAACSSITEQTRVYVCIRWDNAAGADAEDNEPFLVDLTSPDRPVLNQVGSGDGVLRLGFAPSDGQSPATWDVCYREVAGQATAGLDGAGTLGIGGAGGAGGTAGAGGAGGIGGAGGVGGTGGAGGTGGTAGAGGSGGTGGTGGTGGAGGAGGTGGTGGIGGGGGDIPGTGGTGGGAGGAGEVSDICDAGTVKKGISGARRTDTLGGLRNRVTYEVAVRAISAAGNASEPSNIIEGTPYDVEGFWSGYKNAGGSEGGGCSSAAGPASIGLLLSGLFLARRRFGRR